MPTIIGSTTVSANSAATAASTALPPAASISVPAAEASGWLVTTMPRAALAGRFSVVKRVPARSRQVMIVGASGARPGRAVGGLFEEAGDSFGASGARPGRAVGGLFEEAGDSFRQPRVPEVHAGGGAEGAAQILARDVQREVVAELHAPDVLVE